MGAEEFKYIRDVLRHNRDGAIAWDDASYIIESLCRSQFDDLIPRRSERDADGVLLANFADGQIRYEGGV